MRRLMVLGMMVATLALAVGAASAAASASAVASNFSPVNVVGMPIAEASARGCQVPALRGRTLREAKRLLTLLHCKVGKVKRAHSHSISKGKVIGTTPKPGIYKRGRLVALTVSSGPKKRRGR